MDLDQDSTIVDCVACSQLLLVPSINEVVAVTCPACGEEWIWNHKNPDPVASDNIPIGAHLVTPRMGYTHHGIYIGGGEVIHYSGLADGLTSGPVTSITLEGFSGGKNFYIKEHPLPKYIRDEVVARARSRLGEQFYDVATNNCEHFCEWCIEGSHDSSQVDAATGAAASVTSSAIGLVARGVVAGSGAVIGTSGAGIMSGLATAGGVVGGGAVAGIAVLGAIPGAAAASLLNNTVLADNPGHSEEERGARSVGRTASYAGAAVGTLGSVGAVAAAGSVAGLSAAGITSGLAAIGAVVGGGMAAGVVVATAAPAAAAAAIGYGAYKVVKWIEE